MDLNTNKTPGYSGKALWQKLGIKPGMRVRLVDEPANYDQLLGNNPPYQTVATGECELLHIFVTESQKLREYFDDLNGGLVDGGIIWISWPKKSSKIPTDITEQTLRDVILPTGWVDTKVCAVSDEWSGLKFLRRRER